MSVLPPNIGALAENGGPCNRTKCTEADTGERERGRGKADHTSIEAQGTQGHIATVQMIFGAGSGEKIAPAKVPPDSDTSTSSNLLPMHRLCGCQTDLADGASTQTKERERYSGYTMSLSNSEGHGWDAGSGRERTPAGSSVVARRDALFCAASSWYFHLYCDRVHKSACTKLRNAVHTTGTSGVRAAFPLYKYLPTRV
eukprot:1510260-Rhodomonas_salina.1